jgi:hypothetical protein
MAVQIDADSEWLTATTGLPAASPHTVACWVRYDTGLRDQGPWLLYNGGAYWGIYTFNGTNVAGANGGTDYTITTLTVGSWYYLVVVKPNNTSKNTWYAAEGATTVTAGGGGASTSNTFTPNLLSIGGWSPYFVMSRCSIAHFRIWDAALSQAEVEAELVSATAVRTSNLNREYRFANGALTTDSGAGARTLTSGGTPTFTADPTFPSPATRRQRPSAPRGGVINSNFY